MREHQMYITPERAAETVLKQLSPDSCIIVTGQIGCGKTTLAREISTRLGLTHLAIDDFHGDADPKLSAAEAASSIDGGWVAEANVWQIPESDCNHPMPRLRRGGTRFSSSEREPGLEIISGPGYIPPANSTPVAPVPAIYHPCVLAVCRDGSFFLHVITCLPALASIIIIGKMPVPPNLADETSS